MSFVSEHFLFFLSILFVLYYLAPKKFRWILLLTGSLLFYAASGFTLYLALTITSTYLCSLMLDHQIHSRFRSRLILAAWLFVHIGLLAAVKLPAIGLIMPLGISYYTFQSAGYLIDVYHKKVKAERNPAKLALFVSFFPLIIQGPISRYNDLAQTLYTPGAFQRDIVTKGARRILLGFFKKLVIANRLLAPVKLMSGGTEVFTGAYVALNILLYAVLLYADFSGGIDIAIGAANLFGIRVKENFNKPFYSSNIAEYWRRWHITMGSWFRDYLFYPLLACKPMRRFSRISRKHLGTGLGKQLPVFVATLITWLATGLWHGATPNFIAWGLANGIVIILSQACEPLYKRFHTRFAFSNTKFYHGFAIFRTFWLLCAIRSFDIYQGVGQTFRMLFSVFQPWNMPMADIGLQPADCLVALLSVLLLICAGRGRVRRRFDALGPAAKLSLCLLLLCIIIIFGEYGYGYNASQFIYSQV